MQGIVAAGGLGQDCWVLLGLGFSGYSGKHFQGYLDSGWGIVIALCL